MDCELANDPKASEPIPAALEPVPAAVACRLVADAPKPNAVARNPVAEAFAPKARDSVPVALAFAPSAVAASALAIADPEALPPTVAATKPSLAEFAWVAACSVSMALELRSIARLLALLLDWIA